MKTLFILIPFLILAFKAEYNSSNNIEKDKVKIAYNKVFTNSELHNKAFNDYFYEKLNKEFEVIDTSLLQKNINSNTSFHKIYFEILKTGYSKGKKLFENLSEPNIASLKNNIQNPDYLILNKTLPYKIVTKVNGDISITHRAKVSIINMKTGKVKYTTIVQYKTRKSNQYDYDDLMSLIDKVYAIVLLKT